MLKNIHKVVVAFLFVATVNADTEYLGGNAVLSGWTGTNVGANGNDHFVATAVQGAKSAVLDWTKFKVDSGQSMTFDGSGTTFFNLVDRSAGTSEINGLIKGSAGSVWVINPAGIVFGASAQVSLDGLFAAAAGNVSNADALRAGTAMLPEFSSFDGKVEVNGSTFTADQVALLGKSVAVSSATINGGTVAETGRALDGALCVASGNKVVVDEVGGGKVALKISDFADDPSANTIELGDLSVDGTVTSLSGGETRLGNVSSAHGSVNVTSHNSDIQVEPGARIEVSGNQHGIGLYSKKGDVRVGSNASLESANNIQIFSAMDKNAEGDIAVNGKVEAANDLQLVAGHGESASGEVEVSGNIQGRNVLLSSPDGITLKNSDNESPAEILAHDGDIGIYTASGDISIDSGVAVKTVTERVDVGNITLVSATHDNKQGNIVIEGSVNAANRLLVVAGGGQSAVGNVTVEGSLSGKETVVSARGAGGVSLKDKGNVSGSSGVTVMAGGSVDMDAGARITVSDGDLNVHSAAKDDEDDRVNHYGNIVIGGDVNVHGDVLLVSGSGGPTSRGDTTVSGNVASDSKVEIVTRGELAIRTGGGVSGTGDIRLSSSENVALDRETRVCSSKGGVTVYSAGSIDDKIDELGHKGDIVIQGEIQAKTDIRLQSGSGGPKCSGAVKVEGSLCAGSVNVYARNGSIESKGGGGTTVIEATDDTVALTADGGIELVSGVSVRAKDNVDIIAAYRDKANGDIVLNGDVSAGQMVRVNAGRGKESTSDVVVNGQVQANEVYVITGVGEDSNWGTITVGGNISADVDGGGVFLLTGYGKNAFGGGLDVQGHLSAGSLVILRTNNHGEISIGNGATAKVKGEGGLIEIVNAVYPERVGGVKVDGSLDATGCNGLIKIIAGYGKGSSSELSVGGTVRASGEGGSVMMASGYGTDSTGWLKMNGCNVVGNKSVILRTVNGSMMIGGRVTANGETGNVTVWADKGDISFEGGNVRAVGDANLVAGGTVTQSGTYVRMGQGRAEAVSLSPAVSGNNVIFVIKGSLGGGAAQPFVVNGKTYGMVNGTASIAAGNGGDFRGGEGGAPPSIEALEAVSHSVHERKYEFRDETVTMDKFELVKVEIDDIQSDLSPLGSTSTLKVGGDLSVYTAGAIEAKGILAAEGDLTVTAKSFGDVSYLRAGGTLTINNVGHPKHPCVAYFESLDGHEPRINNLPNDMVIFVDGRLAGGNVNIMNMFGANEAFLVSTPELKSTQGIFGDPPFLHSDLDVANPMEVSAIDYLIQEVPRLTLSSEFPADVDQKVEANGLSLKDSYWFGQRRVAARVEDAADGKVASAEEQ